MLGWTLVLVVVVLMVWALARGRGTGDVGRGRSGRGTGADRAEEVLRERYARDEIDEETYRRKLDELRRS